ncbi:copper resistance system multicopper oxidase [Kushneria phyllosphaerae]|uniref:Copper resistance protein A n=1 Tax=Kushneria phyllosphaerae TaxID=2100822 RepID=A0A2R8CIL6_9GAMM|nr:copper resistance system multicopper oxidase [Kushneria phyllosphaerae]SPJ32758.1 Copper resistance protein A [Kushneria phyllosphaerae]
MTRHLMDNDRRRLLLALAGTGALAGVSALLPGYARGTPLTPRAGNAAQVNGGVPGPVLLDFDVRRERVAIAGGHGSGITINRSIPAPLVELWEGQQAHLRIHNHLDEDTSIHWHGLLLPFQMDGVPGVSFPGIAAGETFEVRFPVRQSGTYWYHSHSGMQEQKGLTGPLVVHPASPHRVTADREFVIMLNDWTFDDPHRIMARLKSSGEYYNFNQRTVGDFFDAVEKEGWAATVRDRLAWNNMRMSPRDIADVTGATYSYLMNGLHPAVGWEGVFRPGERIRLRVINASAMTYFNFRIPGLAMTVVGADGEQVEPVDTDEFQIGVAETYDVIVEPQADRAYTLVAESMDRSGHALGTLTPRPGMRAAVPDLRKPPQRTMMDMGMDHGGMAGMNHGASASKGMDHGGMAGMNHGASSSKGMDHGGMAGMNHGASASNGMHHGASASKGMDHGGMAGMNHGASASKGMDHGGMAGMNHGASASKGMDHGGMAGMNHGAMEAGGGMGPVVGQHGPGDHGPGNINVAETLRYRLGEPGTGLEDVDHRVLTYSQLRNIRPMRDQRPPSRTIELHLTGNMERYMWSFDGVKYSESEPIDIVLGDRIRLVLINDTMMEHPIHLHGMFMELENGQGDRLPFKHTLSVLPASRASLLLTADEPGRWAFHCHLLYHMDAGMFRVVRVAPAEVLSNV